MIPTSQLQEFLKDLHICHLGEDDALLQAQECVYWPGIAGDVKQYIRKCDICQSTRPNLQRELLIQHDVPTGPWEKVGTDLFQYKSHNYFDSFHILFDMCHVLTHTHYIIISQ